MQAVKSHSNISNSKNCGLIWESRISICEWSTAPHILLLGIRRKTRRALAVHTYGLRADVNRFQVTLQLGRRREVSETVRAGGHGVNLFFILRHHGHVLLHVVHQPVKYETFCFCISQMSSAGADLSCLRVYCSIKMLFLTWCCSGGTGSRWCRWKVH